jgi:hypothetical protein
MQNCLHVMCSFISSTQTIALINWNFKWKSFLFKNRVEFTLAKIVNEESINLNVTQSLNLLATMNYWSIFSLWKLIFRSNISPSQLQWPKQSHSVQWLKQSCTSVNCTRCSQRLPPAMTETVTFSAMTETNALNWPESCEVNIVQVPN